MKTSILSLIATFAAAGLIAASPVAAKNGGNGGNNGNNGNHNSLKASLGGNSNVNRAISQGIGIALSNGGNLNGGNHNGNRNCGNGGNHNGNNGGNNNGGCNNGGGYDGGYNGGYDGTGDVYSQNQNFPGQAYEPFHSTYVVLPGDSFYTVSLKEYATSANAKYVAQFNNLPQTAALIPGQVLKLPSISATRQLSASRAPAAESLQNTTNASQVTEASTNGNASAQADNAPRPKVNVGSTLLVDGQTFGDKRGAARLRVGGAALKIEVLEWKADAVKIRLPQLDLDSAANADIEVVRADGTLASKTGIELSTATEVVAAQ